jgi:hypothetical protein
MAAQIQGSHLFYIYSGSVHELYEAKLLFINNPIHLSTDHVISTLYKREKQVHVCTDKPSAITWISHRLQGTPIT